MLKLAMFDCDGTLVDGQHRIIAAMAGAWAQEGLNGPEPAAVRRVVGLPLDEAIAQLVPDGDPPLWERLRNHYRDVFLDSHLEPHPDEVLYPGALEALGALEAAGYLLGVATGKGRRGLASVLEAYDLTDRFVTLQTGDMGAGKPAPDMLLRGMAEVGAEASDTVMIGDTVYDMEMAANARVGAIGVAWGYHAPEELTAAGAARVVDHFDHLPAAIAHLVAPPAERVA